MFTEKFKKKRILVTGGLGFIGSHLTETLVSQGYHVVVVDNQSANAVSPNLLSECEVVISDIAAYHSNKPFDEIYHLASVVGPARVLKFAGEIGYRIMSETRTVIKEALKKRARLLFASTSEVYGRSGLVREDEIIKIDPSISVRKAYGVGKLLAEIEILNAIHAKQISANIVRLFNVVGPRQSSEGGFVLPRFIEQAVSGADITVFGTGGQKRSFIHVRDAVEGMITVMNSQVTGEVFNVGNNKNTITIGKLAKLVKSLTHSKSKIVYLDPQKVFGSLYAQTQAKIPDTTKMERFFQWQAKTGLTTIIREAIDKYPNR